MADDIAALLANAAKTTPNNFGFEDVPKAYWAGLEQAYKQRTRDAFQDPSLYNPDGTINVEKATSQAFRAGGIPAAEAIGKLNEAGYNQLLQRGSRQFQDDLRPGNQPPQYPPSSSRSEVKPDAPPAAAAATPAAQPPPPPPPALALQPPDTAQPPQAFRPPVPTPTAISPQPSSGTFAQFLTAQGVPPEQHGAEAQKIQAAMMKETGRPFDTNVPLNMTDPTTREVLKNYAAARAYAQAPVQPRPVPTEPVKPPPTTPAPAARVVDETLNNTIPPNLLARGGGTAAGTLDYLIRIAPGLTAKDKDLAEKLIHAIQEQLKYTTEQKNAAAAGRSVREVQDLPGDEAQKKVVLDSVVKGLGEGQTEAKSLRDSINNAHRTRALLDSRPGVVTGIFSKDRLNLMRVANLIGVPNADRISTTEDFNSAISEGVLNLAQTMKGTISDKDVAFLRQINGSSDLNEQSLRQMLDIGEKVARAKLKSHNEQVGAAAEAYPAIAASRKFYSVTEPGEYKKLSPALKEGDRIGNKDGTVDVIRNGKRVRETP